MAENSKPFSNRIALVTGASRGIGYATALALAKGGAHVVAAARTVGGLEELDDAIKSAGGSATLVPLDMKDADGIARLAEKLNERYQRLDILIGNAAVLGPSSPIHQIDPKDWQDTFAINVFANLSLIRTMEGLLAKSDAGRAVFVTSAAGWRSLAYRGPYAVTKAALDSLVRVYAAETATTPVRVNLFNPGPIRTRMRATVMPGEDPMTLDTPEQAAAAIVSLCLPSVTDTGRIYDYATKKFIDFRMPEGKS
jgi:NAD(P)-dependent dehydrogenase (short-subunit alcohol dehydrogenase family)